MRESAAPRLVAAGLCMPSRLGWPDYSRGRNLMPIVETLPGHPGPGPHLLRGGLFFCLFSGARPPRRGEAREGPAGLPV